MKKRIISIALIVAMVVAMIPATLLSAFAAAYDGHGNGYDVYVSDKELTLDGKMDAAYANSEKIVQGYRHTAGADFEAYAVATATGVYYFASVIDSTVSVSDETTWGIGSGDKLQIYMQVANTVTTGEGDSAVTETQYAMGYFDCDYAHEASAQKAGVKNASVFTDAGYDIEIFVPWSNWTGITNGITLETVKFWFGIQNNNYQNTTNKGLACDNPATSGYWTGHGCSGTTAPAKYMIPANLIKSAKVVKDLKYTTVVTDETITLDGKRDDTYLLSEKITSQKVSVGTYGVNAGFETYLVGTDEGFYIFASIYDDTLDKAEAVADGLRAQDGDKFQIYLQLGNNVWNRWGYIDFDYVDGGRHLITKQTLGYATDGIQQKAVIWPDNKGWDIEIFLPHNISADDRFGTSDINSNWNDLLMKVNFQALNETCTDWNENGYCTARNRHGLAYDIAETGNAWNGPTYKGSYFVPVDFSINPATVPGTGALTYSSSITLDGVKDDSYGDDSLAFVLDKARNSNFTSENGNEYAKAWVTVTGSNVYLYALVNDTTLAASPSDAVCLYTYFPLTDTCIYFGGGYARSGHIETTARWSGNIFHSTNKDETTTSSSIGEGQAIKNLGDGWYAIEFTYTLPRAEQAAIARGETLNLGVGIQHRDRDTSGNIKAYNRSGYESYWSDATYTKNSLPRFEVSKNSTSANLATVEPAITGANVALGESITLNYIATAPAYAENVSMKVTMNGNATFVKGVPTANANEYKFAYTGIAPQCMGDSIDAALYIGGNTTGDKETGYSVAKNLKNLVAGDEDLYDNDDLEQLVYDLLAYGAAAQDYANYKTDALVNAGYEDGTQAGFELPNVNDKTVSAPIADAKFTAAGVYHANANKLYAKIKADDISKVTATVNGEAAIIERYTPTGEYIVYSEDISVKEFDEVYTFVITTEEGSQTLTYSVNTWCTVKSGSNNDRSTTQALAQALYAYGCAAENYVG